MTSVKKLLGNFITLFAGNVIGQLFFFFGLAFLARVLGPSGFGVWNFAQVCMLYLLRAGDFGLEVVGIKETSRNPKLVSTWITTVVSLRFIFAVLLFGLAFLISRANLLPDGTASLVLISALSVFPAAILLEWVLEARQAVGFISIARILKGVLFFLGVLIMVSHSEDAELAAYLYVGSVALPGLIVFSFVISRFGFDWSSFRPRKGLDALIKSTPIGIATLLSQYSMFAATMMVGYFLSKEDLGFFTAAHRIVIFLWAYIISSQQRILLPSLSKSFHESLPQFREFVEKFFRLSALAAVPIGLIGTVCSTALMMLLYSARYEASGVVFGILLWGFVFANIRSILETALIASDRQMRLMKGMAFLSIMYTIMTPILTLQFGIIGTAIAVVVSELSYFTYLIFSSPYSKPVSLLKGFWKPLLAALIAMITLLPLIELSLVLRVVLGSTVFGIIVVALKGVTRDDFKVITFLFRRNNLEPST